MNRRSLDEQPIQLLKETREPIPATKEHPLRVTRQCVTGRRFATIEELRSETVAWHEYINDKQRGVDWQFCIEDARIKLKSLYPNSKP